MQEAWVPAQGQGKAVPRTTYHKCWEFRSGHRDICIPSHFHCLLKGRVLPCNGVTALLRSVCTHACSQLTIILTPSNPAAPPPPLGQQQQFSLALLHRPVASLELRSMPLLSVSSISCTVSKWFLLKLIPSFLRGVLKDMKHYFQMHRSLVGVFYRHCVESVCGTVGFGFNVKGEKLVK